MSVITFTLDAVNMHWELRRNDVEFRSIFGSQAQEVTEPLWVAMLRAAIRNDTDSGNWKALLMKMRGRTNQLALHDFGRPVPIGTMRGSMIFASAPSAGSVSLAINAGAGQASTTLLPGDLLGFGSGTTQQVVMNTSTATANASGGIAIVVEPPTRNDMSSGAIVTWNAPKALFRLSGNMTGWDYMNSVQVGGMGLDLIEDVRP